MPERDELDRLIDSELARYAEPRTGLEQRVLAQVAADGANRSSWSWVFRGWQRWVLAGTITAIVLSVVVQIQRTPHRETTITTARATTPDHAPIVSPGITAPAGHTDIQHVEHTRMNTKSFLPRAKHIAAPQRAQHPKLDVFPAPQPLSVQEQTLVAIATARSDLARENLIASQRQLGVPLQISSIEIPPLTRPDEGIK